MADPRDEYAEQHDSAHYRAHQDQQIQELLSRAELKPPSDPPEEKM